MAFLDTHFATLNPLTAFGIILALGILGGQIATRSIHLPAITGYILTGLVIGPHGLNLLNQTLLDASELFVQLALGLALFEMGRRIDLHWLLRERALGITTLISAILLFCTLMALLSACGFPLQGGAMIAALALASSPAALLEVMRETRAEGQVSERMIAHAGLGNLLAMITLILVLGYAHGTSSHDLEHTLLQPGWLLLGSSAIGLSAGLIAIRLNLWVGAKQREAQEVLLFALIALTVGLSASWHLLPSLALLVFGLSTRSLRRGYTVSSPYLIRHSVVFFVALFVSTGTRLDLHSLLNHLYLAPLLVGARSMLHIFTGWLLAPANGLSRRNGALLGLGLMPMAGNAGTLLLISSAALPQSNSQVIGLLIAMLCLTELLGPILTRLALTHARETP
jgi:Kef-type K+ transport system membrane component KefB